MPLLRRVLLLALCALLALPGGRRAGDCDTSTGPMSGESGCCATGSCCCEPTADSACGCQDDQQRAPAPTSERLGIAIGTLPARAVATPRFATIHAAPRTLTASLPPPHARAHWVLPHRTRQVVYSVWRS
ncbi:MAG: hypothetical protein AB7I19_11545 [Planctomycetota bacterium]